MNDLVPSLLIIASIALIAGSVWLWNRDRKRAMLMVIAAVVLFANAWLISGMPEASPPVAPSELS